MVASRVGGLHEVIDHGVTGFLHPARRPRRDGRERHRAADRRGAPRACRRRRAPHRCASVSAATWSCPGTKRSTPKSCESLSTILDRRCKDAVQDPGWTSDSHAKPCPFRSSRVVASVLLLLLCLTGPLPAQLRVQPVGELPADASLRLMLRKLSSVGTFMETTAHPDDEDNALLAMMSHGAGHAVGARDRDARRRRPERDRAGDLPGARRAAHRGAAGRSPVRRRGAVLHARDRLRLLVQPRGVASRSGGTTRSSAISSGTSAPRVPT